MNFEVYQTEQEARDRAFVLHKTEAEEVIVAFNGNVWTVKWR